MLYYGIILFVLISWYSSVQLVKTATFVRVDAEDVSISRSIYQALCSSTSIVAVGLNLISISLKGSIVQLFGVSTGYAAIALSQGAFLYIASLSDRYDEIGYTKHTLLLLLIIGFLAYVNL